MKFLVQVGDLCGWIEVKNLVENVGWHFLVQNFIFEESDTSHLYYDTIPKYDALRKYLISVNYYTFVPCTMKLYTNFRNSSNFVHIKYNFDCVIGVAYNFNIRTHADLNSLINYILRRINYEWLSKFLFDWLW